SLRENNSEKLLEETNLKSASLYFAGETAKQADTMEVNDRDTVAIVIFITLLITLLLAIQSKSVMAPRYMIATLILSYFAAIGLSNFLFESIFGYHAMSFRPTVYSFIFLV